MIFLFKKQLFSIETTKTAKGETAFSVHNEEGDFLFHSHEPIKEGLISKEDELEFYDILFNKCDDLEEHFEI